MDGMWNVCVCVREIERHTNLYVWVWSLTWTTSHLYSPELTFALQPTGSFARLVILPQSVAPSLIWPLSAQTTLTASLELQESGWRWAVKYFRSVHPPPHTIIINIVDLIYSNKYHSRCVLHLIIANDDGDDDDEDDDDDRRRRTTRGKLVLIDIPLVLLLE